MITKPFSFSCFFVFVFFTKFYFTVSVELRCIIVTILNFIRLYFMILVSSLKFDFCKAVVTKACKYMKSIVVVK